MTHRAGRAPGHFFPFSHCEPSNFLRQCSLGLQMPEFFSDIRHVGLCGRKGVYWGDRLIGAQLIKSNSQKNGRKKNLSKGSYHRGPFLCPPYATGAEGVSNPVINHHHRVQSREIRETNHHGSWYYVYYVCALRTSNLEIIIEKLQTARVYARLTFSVVAIFSCFRSISAYFFQ